MKKTIFWRALIYLGLFALLVGSLAFFVWQMNGENVPFVFFVGGLALLVLFFVLFFYVEVSRPLRIMLEQMKMLLTGRQYKRIYTKRMDELGIIAHFFNEVTKSFEKVSYDIKEGKRMLNELEIASQLQKDVLPKESPALADLDIIAKTRPAVELGGDSFDFITRGDNTFIYIGDVTGHGVPSALVMTMVNTLIHTFVEVYDNAYDVLVNTNKQLKTRIKSTMFMTLVMLRWNQMSKTMTYVGAGHEYLVVFRAATGKCDLVKAGGIALGMVPDNSKLIEEKSLTLEKDDVIILYSDGLTEGRNMAGEMYELDRLVAAIERFAPQYGAEGIVHHIALDYSRFVEEHIQDDDVTLMAIHYVGSGKVTTASSDARTTSWSAPTSSSGDSEQEERVEA